MNPHKDVTGKQHLTLCGTPLKLVVLEVLNNTNNYKNSVNSLSVPINNDFRNQTFLGE